MKRYRGLKQKALEAVVGIGHLALIGTDSILLLASEFAVWLRQPYGESH